MKKQKYKTEWNLRLLYKSPNDPQIEKDVKKIERAFTNFAKKYKGKTGYLTNESSLLKALKDYEKMFKSTPSDKPIYYLWRMQSLDSNDSKIEAQINRLSDRLTKAGNNLTFFNISLGTIAPKLKKKFLKSKKLEHYRYMLKVLFDHSKYYLTEEQEKIMSLKSMPSYGMWVQGLTKTLNKRTVKLKGKQVPISEAAGKIGNLKTKERRLLGRDISKEYIAVSDFAESEINAIFSNKKISDELRGYKEPYSSAVLGDENREEVVANLVKSVSSMSKISHRFYSLKKKILKLDHLEYVDKNASIGTVKKNFTFNESVEILQNGFGKAGSIYVQVLNDFLKNGQIDVYPKVGKRGGAYQVDTYGLPTYVFLNHVDNFRSLQTFAHEMGHAFHSYFSKKQPIIYQDYTTAVAETASTFFENLAFDEIFKKLSDKEKIIALHDDIGDSVSTIFRQIALFNFELELHKKVRAEGFVPKEEIANMLNKHMKSYLGPAFKMKEDDGYAFVGWPHIRYYFYTYSYAFGELISNALYEKYKEDPKYMRKIERFLSAGGSKPPYEIFKEIGIDIGKKDFWRLGLKKIEDDIKRLEKLVG